MNEAGEKLKWSTGSTPVQETKGLSFEFHMSWYLHLLNLIFVIVLNPSRIFSSVEWSECLAPELQGGTPKHRQGTIEEGSQCWCCHKGTCTTYYISRKFPETIYREGTTLHGIILTLCKFASSIIIIQKICSVHISTLLGAQAANPETPGQVPFSFTISILGSFTCITQHTGPTPLRLIRRTKQLWLSVLLKDTSAATGQAGIQTHILTTPELESNALDHSATTFFASMYMDECHFWQIPAHCKCSLSWVCLFSLNRNMH